MMEPKLAQPGETVDIWSTMSDGETLAVVLRTQHMEWMRLHLNAGARVPTHQAQGEVVVLCVQGRLEITAMGALRELHSGQLLYLLVHEPFELFAHEESSLLITILRPHAEITLFGDDVRKA